MNIKDLKRRFRLDFAVGIFSVAMAAAPASSFAQNAGATADQPAPTAYYRVELIVFSHVNGQSDAYRSPELADYRNVLDPLQLAEAQLAAAEALAKFQNLAPMVPSHQTTLNSKESSGNNSMPELYLAQTELSKPMQSVLERLDRSTQYQPISWRGWYQTAKRGQTNYWVRVHDQEPIGHSPQSDPIVENDQIAEQDQRMHYRLDGQARLRQRQFLHLDFDLEWREAAGRPAPILMPGSSVDALSTLTDPLPTEWNVHRFDQSRIVRVDRIEYFDSGWLGVVALLTRIVPAEPPQPDEPAMDTEATAVGSVGTD